MTVAESLVLGLTIGALLGFLIFFAYIGWGLYRRHREERNHDMNPTLW